MEQEHLTFEPGSLDAVVAARLEALHNDNFVMRLWQKDTTIWSSVPVPELDDRLGWLGLPVTAPSKVADYVAFAKEIAGEGFADVVLLGMGGSSLAPEVFQETFGNATGMPRLSVLDSTHPAAVERVAGAVTLDKTLFVVSSKSGSTIETLSFFRYFWARVSGQSETPGRQFIAITDPGSSLEKLAGERSFRRVFSAPPEVGGRYSALTEFGLVPAALIGVEVAELVARTADMAAPTVFNVPIDENPAVKLGVCLGEAALAGRDKLTLLASPKLASLPDWIEQLVAESTGKNGKGIVPVTGEPLLDADAYHDDRFFVSIATGDDNNAGLDALVAAGHPVVRVRLRDTLDLGREFYRWEVATAVAGSILGIQPFDQPDVQLAKDLAKRAMAGESFGDAVPVVPVADASAPVSALLANAKSGTYVSVHAYLQPEPDVRAALDTLAQRLRARTGVPVTVEFGPRFLHSTGQLHKGGDDNGLFLQILDRPASDVPVPEADFTFGQLIAAQADGDAAALAQRGRHIVRVDVTGDAQLGALTQAIG